MMPKTLLLFLSAGLSAATIPTTYVLDSSNSLYTGLAAAWPINENAGLTITDKKNSIACVGTGVASPSWTTNDTSGPALSFPGGGTTGGMDCGTPASVQDIGNGYSASWFFRIHVAAGVSYDLMQRNDSNSVKVGWKIGQVSGGLLSFKHEYSTTNSNATYSTISGSLSTGWHDIAVVYDGGPTAAGIAVYLDGSLQTQSTSTNGAPLSNGTGSDATNHLLFGVTTFDTSGEFKGIVDVAYIWVGRQLASGDVSSLHASPYQLFISSGVTTTPVKHRVTGGIQ